MKNKFFDYYFKFLQKAKWGIVVIWLVLLIVGIKIGPKFLKNTKASMNPPPNSDADKADQKFSDVFPAQANVSTLIVYCTIADTSGDITTADDTYLRNLTSILNNQFLTGPWGVDGGSNNIVEVDGFYTYYDTELYPLCAKFVSGNSSSIIQVKYHPPSGTDLGDMISYLRDQLDDVAVPSGWSIGLTGQDALFQDIVDGTASDMARMDIIVLPLALLTLAFVVRSWRLMIIPVISVFCSLMTSFMIMYPISLHVYNVASVCPSVMMSLTIAMSIDYSLFLLTRYREEHSKGKVVTQAVKNMEFYAGHIVAISGCTLAITFVALAFFPMDFLKSIGVGAALALACTMSVNLTLTPSILLCGDKIFYNFDTPWIIVKIKELLPCWKPKPENNINQGASQSGDLSHVQEEYPGQVIMSPMTTVEPYIRASHTDEDYRKLQAQRSSIWYRSAMMSTTSRCSVIIIVIVTAIAIPFLMEVTKMSTTIDTNQLIPRNSDALSIFNNFKTTFPAGQIKPFDVIMDTGIPNGTFSQSFWDYQRNFTMSLINRTTGVSLANTAQISGYYSTLDDALACLTQNQTSEDKDCPFYQYLVASLTNADKSCTYVSYVTDFDPTGDDSPTFIDNARKVITDYRNEYPHISLDMTGGAVDSYDAVAEVTSLFPYMIGGTCAAVFVIVGFLFRSVFVPLRLLLTIAVPITWIYGLAVLVFQEGIVDWAFPTLNDYNSIYWLIPVMCFSILVGLGLDYDIFLFSRIVEYRKLGYQDRVAVTKGVYRTGGIITAAGVIMFIAFAGLMLSSEMVLNQYGFFLSFAVLVDTFVVRTLLVPAIIHLAGPINWWPGHMPPETRDADSPELDEEDVDKEGEEGDGDRESEDYDRSFENTADLSAKLITNNRTSAHQSHGIND